METKGNYRIDYHQLDHDLTIEADELKLFLVLKGKMNVIQNSENYHLQTGDLYLINFNETAKLLTDTLEPCYYIELYINSLFFVNQFPPFFYTKFECTPLQIKQGKSEQLLTIKSQIASLYIQSFTGETAQKLKETLSLCEIILNLVDNFQTENSSRPYSVNSSRLSKIIEFLHENYQHNITLSDVAEHFFMSESTLSKLFKKETGDYFSNYLTSLRIRHSISELTYTDNSIEQIAIANGFNNSKTYREHFKKNLGTSPSTYRIEHVKKPSNNTLGKKLSVQDFHAKDVLLALYSFISESGKSSHEKHRITQQKKIHIHSENEEYTYNNSELIIHIGSLTELMFKNKQDELILLKEQQTIDYLSIDSLFDDFLISLKTYEDKHRNMFPLFASLEPALDFIVQQELSLFFNFSLDKWEKMSHKSKNLYKEFLRHINNQYPSILSRQCKINVILDGLPVDKAVIIFQQIKQALHAFVPTINFGIQLSVLDPFFDYSTEPHIRSIIKKMASSCDFFSFTAEPNYVFHSSNETLPDLKNYHQYVINKSSYIQYLLKEKGIKRPLYLTHWNTLTGMTEDSNGIFFRGAIILQDIIELNKLVVGLGFWLNTELYDKKNLNEPTKNDGLQLFHYYDNKRPVYFCLMLLQRLKGKVIATGENYLLTENLGHYQLLIWNTNYFDPHFSSEESFLKSHISHIALSIEHFSPGRYQMKQFSFNRHHGALFYSYEKFKKAEILDLEAHDYIKRTTYPELTVFDRDIPETFDYTVTLDTNAITLIEFDPISGIERE